MKKIIENSDVNAGERFVENNTTRNSLEIANMRVAIEDADVGAREGNDVGVREGNDVGVREGNDVGARERNDVGARERNANTIARDANTKLAKERNFTDAAARKKKNTLRGTNAGTLVKVTLFYKIFSSQ